MKMKMTKARPASRNISHMRTTLSLNANSIAAALLLSLSLTGVSGLVHAASPKLASPLAAVKLISFQEMAGWQDETFEGFWKALEANCAVMRLRTTAWAQRCQEFKSINSSDSTALRRWIESRFTPYQLSDSKGTRSATITGYFEPVVRGSRTQGGRFQVPLYQTPRDLVNVDLSSIYPEIKALRLRGRLEGNRVVPYPTRAEIEKNRLLAGLELVWLDDPIDAFFLQVQGSGRVELPGGESIRVGYAEQNGHPYRSIGRYLIERGELKANEASMQGIRAWLDRNPSRRDELLHQNPSVVFFKEIRRNRQPGEPDGPLGSMGIPLSAERSIAVDPRFVEAGSLVFVSTRVPAGAGTGQALAGKGFADKPFRQLMIAQDSGSAIVGVHRGDIFFGSGTAAGETAGRMRSEGSMVLLLPNN